MLGVRVLLLIVRPPMVLHTLLLIAWVVLEAPVLSLELTVVVLLLEPPESPEPPKPLEPPEVAMPVGMAWGLAAAALIARIALMRAPLLPEASHSVRPSADVPL